MGEHLSRVLQGNHQIMTDTPKTFVFTDDPEGAEKCQMENPDAVIIQIVIIDPDICEYRPCKHPACTCPQNYRLGRAKYLGFNAPSPAVH
jgi:hypothetical protein